MHAVLHEQFPHLPQSGRARRTVDSVGINWRDGGIGVVSAEGCGPRRQAHQPQLTGVAALTAQRPRRHGCRVRGHERMRHLRKLPSGRSFRVVQLDGRQYIGVAEPEGSNFTDVVQLDRSQHTEVR